MLAHLRNVSSSWRPHFLRNARKCQKTLLCTKICSPQALVVPETATAVTGYLMGGQFAGFAEMFDPWHAAQSLGVGL